jgi:hypothetical protein
MAGVRGGVGVSKFSERLGFVPMKVDLGVRDMPVSLQNGLWDATKLFYLDGDLEFFGGGEVKLKRQLRYIADRLWFDFFRDSLDNSPRRAHELIRGVKQHFYSANFYMPYDLIEYMANLDEKEADHVDFDSYTKFCNNILERERSPFRFAGRSLVQVTSEEGRAAIEDAVTQDISVAVSRHIKRAAELYSDPTAPDYRNSVKEAISAVEAAVRFVSGRKSVGVEKPLQSVMDDFVVHKAMRVGLRSFILTLRMKVELDTPC